VSKPKVYWRQAPEDHDPLDSCWAVKMPGRNGTGSLDIGIGSWSEAYRWAFLTAALEKIEA